VSENFRTYKKSGNGLTSLPLNRVICGDALEVIDNFPHESIDLIIIDPPYSRTVAPEDSLADFKILEPFFRELFSIVAKILKKDGYVFVFTDFRRYAPVFYGSYNYLKPVNLIIWEKGFIGPGVFFRPLHELILCCIKKSNDGVKPPKNRHISDIWKAKRVTNRMHPFQKPKNLYRIMIENCSDEKDIVLDPFCGSGTSLTVAEQMDRKWIGIDINPEYVEMSKKRLRRECSQKLSKFVGVVE